MSVPINRLVFDIGGMIENIYKALTLRSDSHEDTVLHCQTGSLSRI